MGKGLPDIKIVNEGNPMEMSFEAMRSVRQWAPSEIVSLSQFVTLCAFLSLSVQYFLPINCDPQEGKYPTHFTFHCIPGIVLHKRLLNVCERKEGEEGRQASGWVGGWKGWTFDVRLNHMPLLIFIG